MKNKRQKNDSYRPRLLTIQFIILERYSIDQIKTGQPWQPGVWTKGPIKPCHGSKTLQWGDLRTLIGDGTGFKEIIPYLKPFECEQCVKILRTTGPAIELYDNKCRVSLYKILTSRIRQFQTGNLSNWHSLSAGEMSDLEATEESIKA